VVRESVAMLQFESRSNDVNVSVEPDAVMTSRLFGSKGNVAETRLCAVVSSPSWLGMAASGRSHHERARISTKLLRCRPTEEAETDLANWLR